VRPLDEEFGIWCDYDFQCSCTNFEKAVNCRNEQCIFIACCISQKIEGVYVTSIELLIHCRFRGCNRNRDQTEDCG
jgi:hypothetical protein